jgi:hypothetical protein
VVGGEPRKDGMARSVAAAALALTGLAFGAGGCAEDEQPFVTACSEASGAPGPVTSRPQCPALAMAEGGEIRLEQVEVPGDEATADLVDGQAFVFHRQAPERRLLDGVPIEGTDCFDLGGGDTFDSGPTAANQSIADSRAYFYVGAEVPLWDTGGGKLSLERRFDEADPAVGLRHEVLYLGTTEREDTAGRRYDVGEIAGTVEYAGWDLRRPDGRGDVGVAPEYARAVFLPPRFTMTSPAEADFVAGPELAADRPLELAWQTTGPPADGAPPLLGYVSFAGADGAVDVRCAQVDAAALVVPAAIVEQLEPAGTMTVGLLHHVAWNQGVSAAVRLDLIGVSARRVAYRRLP